MSVPQMMPSPRQQLHKLVCATQYECKYKGALDRSLWCTYLDDLLDHNDEMLLHAKARELYSRWEQMPSGRNVHVPGVLWSVRQVDPFEEVDDGGVIDILSPKSVDGYPGCPKCEKGTKHYHRKSDGSLVTREGM